MTVTVVTNLEVAADSSGKKSEPEMIKREETKDSSADIETVQDLLGGKGRKRAKALPQRAKVHRWRTNLESQTSLE